METCHLQKVRKVCPYGVEKPVHRKITTIQQSKLDCANENFTMNLSLDCKVTALGCDQFERDCCEKPAILAI